MWLLDSPSYQVSSLTPLQSLSFRVVRRCRVTTCPKGFLTAIGQYVLLTTPDHELKIRLCFFHAPSGEGVLVCSQLGKHLSKQETFKNQVLTLKGGKFQFHGKCDIFLCDAYSIGKSKNSSLGAQLSLNFLQHFYVNFLLENHISAEST